MIYRFDPIHRPLIWGSEEWLISSVPGAESRSTDGESIAALLHRHGERLVGKHAYALFGDTFPLLIKFIDAHTDLSVQVHPGDAFARAHGEPRGKTEMWYALLSEPGAKLYCGLKQHLTSEQYRQMVEDKTIVSALAEYEVHAGDCFFIPAGRIHSICSGCRICEIQQTSDTTYRIYDYDRRDKDGNLRQLHTELAAQSINFDDYGTDACINRERPADGQKPDAVSNLISCPYFTTNVLQFSGLLNREYTKLDSFVCLICLRGEGSIQTNDRDIEGSDRAAQTFHAGELLLLPATTETVELKTEDALILECYIE